MGHQALLCACRKQAEEQGCKSGAVTFSGHPDRLLRGAAPGLINTPQDRNKLLRQFDMETVLELPFDEAMMAMPWQEFCRMLICEHGASGFVCGSDFRFGKGGEGTAQTLAGFCEQEGLCCRVVPQQELYGVRISSTHIRALLEQGKLQEAAGFLGHPHILTGTVAAGKQLGRTIGIPTANLSYPRELLMLPHGVYACRVQWDGACYNAMTNIGTRPTVSGTGVTVESHLLGFSGDLYGKTIQVSFYEYLRPEHKFPNLSCLEKQIEKDKFLVEKVMQNY